MVSWLTIVGVTVTAQQPPQSSSSQTPPTPPGLKSGNPTPGTPQPETPNLADRITLTGCVVRLQGVVLSSTPADPNALNDTRFILTQAARKNVAPPDTGTSSAAERPGSQKYRLRGIASQLSPFVGAQVEISGEVVAGSGTPGVPETPTLQVEFVQKLTSKCQ